MKYLITNDGCFYSEDELKHFGVPGMKWGVRKACQAYIGHLERKKKNAKKNRVRDEIANQISPEKTSWR